MELKCQKVYQRNECVLFMRTKERFGGLSNMAGGYPLSISSIHIPTSEALYQACRFPHKPELQKIIIGQKSPMTAKMKSKPYRKDSRPDWDSVRVDIMWWCLRVKLAQHWEEFGDLLLSTGGNPIIEESYKDQFWGAKPVDKEMLVGINVLGQLLTMLREQLKGLDADKLRCVPPPTLSQFLLIDKPVGTIKSTTSRCETLNSPTKETMQLSFDFMQLALPTYENA
jgi:type I restriction enzyme, S subunit